MTTEDKFLDLRGLDSLRSASCEDIRAFFSAVVDQPAAEQETAMPADGIGGMPIDGDHLSPSAAMLDDLTIVFQHTLERSRSRGELSAGLDLDVVARQLTATFRGVLLMQHEGSPRAEIQRFVDQTLKLIA